MVGKKACPVCDNKNFELFVDFGSLPRSDNYVKDPKQKPEYINLSFEYCKNCAYIRQKHYQEHNYVNDSRRTEHTLMNYCNYVIDYLKKSGVKDNDLIIDVGCNDGAFLDLLKSRGFVNLLGIDPSVAAFETCKKKDYRIENVFFDIEQSEKIKSCYGPASVVIYRHVLEHVQEPLSFLLAAKNLLRENGKIFIEIPDSRNIIDGLNAHELLDQHISYFIPQNLTAIVNKAGFEIKFVLIKPYMGTDAILLFGSKNPSVKRNSLFYENYSQECERFEDRWNKFSNEIKKEIIPLKTPITAMGASHPQSRFLALSGLGEFASELIDDDPNKFGKYVCVPNPIKIISTKEYLASNPKGTLFHTAFGYDNWFEKIQKRLANKINFVWFKSRRLKDGIIIKS